MDNDEKTRLHELFFARCSLLTHETIMIMKDHDSGAGINNVVTGLDIEAFGLSLIDEELPIKYLVFYINGESTLKGDVIEMSVTDKDRDSVMLLFSQYLSEKYLHLDAIEIFNTFQKQLRAMLEKLGYLTYCPTEINAKEGTKFTLIAKGVSGIFRVPSVDKLAALKSLFSQKKMRDEVCIEEDNFIYLMFNSRNNMMKIGRSRRPSVREKTLQGEEPEMVILAYWRAPNLVEKELHNTYNEKRTRGEWFRLSFRDLQEIKIKMSQYE